MAIVIEFVSEWWQGQTYYCPMNAKNIEPLIVPLNGLFVQRVPLKLPLNGPFIWPGPFGLRKRGITVSFTVPLIGFHQWLLSFPVQR